MELKVKCSKCGKEISLNDAEMFDVPILVCSNLSYAKQIGRTVYFICEKCSENYEIVESYMGRPIIKPKSWEKWRPQNK